MTARFEKLRCLVLKRTKLGEADLILHLLKPTGAKISVLARAALKSKKRFSGGVLEPTHLIEVVIRPHQQEDGLATLEEAKLLESFEGLRQSYDCLEMALSLVETVDRIAQNGEASSSHLFDYLGYSLRALQIGVHPENLQVLFYLKILYAQGVLELEPWMSAFLAKKLSDLKKEEAFPPLSKVQTQWVHDQILVYIKTAQVTGGYR